MRPKTPAQLLREAADYIAKHGLQKDDWGAPGHACCAWGALNVAQAGQADPMAVDAEDLPEDLEWLDAGDVSEAVHVARVTLARAVGMSVPDWNDRRGVGVVTVTAKMREVADQLDARAVSS